LYCWVQENRDVNLFVCEIGFQVLVGQRKSHKPVRIVLLSQEFVEVRKITRAPDTLRSEDVNNQRL
jgi:hypothetical protein